MKFTRYSKFKGLDISALNLGELMEGLSDTPSMDTTTITTGPASDSRKTLRLMRCAARSCRR